MKLSKLSLTQLGGITMFLIVVTFLVVFFSSQVKVTVSPTAVKADGVGAGAQHISGIFIPDEATPSVFGSATSPSVINGCQEINGTTICDYGSAFTTASTTCAFKLPSATSTLQSAAARIANPQGTANIGEWGYSRTDSFSTTTSLGFALISATLQTIIVASSTGTTNLNPVNALPPGGWLVFKTGSTTPTGVTGRCSAEINII